jgi:hypothetical protein
LKKLVLNGEQNLAPVMDHSSLARFQNRLGLFITRNRGRNRKVFMGFGNLIR